MGLGVADDKEAAQADKEEGNLNDPSTATVFKKLGSWSALHMAVDIFYKKVLGDPLLAPYFEGIPMHRLRKKQMLFMAFAFGGANAYFGKQVAYAHRKMILERGLGLPHFDAVAGHFVATLTELGVSGDLIAEAAGMVLSTRPLFDPQTVFAEAEAIARTTNAPLQSSLMTLQAELTTSADASAASAASSRQPSTVGADGEGEGLRERPSASSPLPASGKIRVSTLAEVFAPQVLGRSQAAAFQSTRGATTSQHHLRLAHYASEPGLRPSNDSTDGHTQAALHTSVGGDGGDGGAGGARASNAGLSTASLDLSLQEEALLAAVAPRDAATPVPEQMTPEEAAKQAALEAKKLRRAMLKEVLRGIGVLPATPASVPGSASLGPSIPPTPTAISTSLSDLGDPAIGCSGLYAASAPLPYRLAPAGASASGPATAAPASSHQQQQQQQEQQPQQLLMSAIDGAEEDEKDRDSLVGNWLRNSTAAAPLPGPSSSVPFPTLSAATHATVRMAAGAEDSSDDDGSSSGVSFMDSDEELQKELMFGRPMRHSHYKPQAGVRRQGVPITSQSRNSRLSFSTDGPGSVHDSRNSATSLSQLATAASLQNYLAAGAGAETSHSAGQYVLDMPRASSAQTSSSFDLTSHTSFDRLVGGHVMSLATLEEVSETVSSAYESGRARN